MRSLCCAVDWAISVTLPGRRLAVAAAAVARDLRGRCCRYIHLEHIHDRGRSGAIIS